MPKTTGSASAKRVLSVLEALIEADAPLTLTELAARTDVPLATCSVVMSTFEGRGYAQRTVVGRSHLWRPTLRVYELGMAALRRVELGSASEPHLNALRDSTGLPAHLGVLDGASIVYVARAATRSIVQFSTYPGRMAPFNLTALGRAVAAFRPDEQIEELLRQAVPGSGPRATDHRPAALRLRLDEVRRLGYAIEDQEEEAGVACIAAPVFGADGSAAAIGVTGLVDQVLGEPLERVAREVVAAADALSRRTGAPAGIREQAAR